MPNKQMPYVQILQFDDKSGLIVFNTDALVAESSNQKERTVKEFVDLLNDELAEQHSKRFEDLFYSHISHVLEVFMDTLEISISAKGCIVKYDNPDPNVFMFGMEFCVINADLITHIWEV